MPIPKHHEIRIPALQLLASTKKSLKLKEFELPLSKHFKLTEEELIQMYDSGNGPVFYDRISWALSYLKLASLVQKPRRGTYEISDKGMEMLKTPGKIKAFVDKAMEKRYPLQKKNSKMKYGMMPILL